MTAAHAHRAHLAGGLVDVDVFFMSSGYRIGGLLPQEFGTTGRPDMSDAIRPLDTRHAQVDGNIVFRRIQPMAASVAGA